MAGREPEGAWGKSFPQHIGVTVSLPSLHPGRRTPEGQRPYGGGALATTGSRPKGPEPNPGSQQFCEANDWRQL